MASRREPSSTIVPIRDATPRAELWLYAGAALSYVVCGFFVKQIFAWWWFGAAWFVGFVWLVPKGWDRLHGRSSPPSGSEPGVAGVDTRDDSGVAS
jgi:hypothetical protein